MDRENPVSSLLNLQRYWLCCLLVIWSPSVSQCATAPKDFIPLFNGKNLDGLYTWLVDSQHEDPREVFSVSNGQIRISGDGLGYLGTRESYENYDLYLEFRWGKKNWKWGDRIGRARDSGLFLNATGRDGNSVDGQGAFMAAIECNIFQGATGDILLIRGRTRNNKLISPNILANVNSNRDSDEWFTWDPMGTETSIETVGRVNWRRKAANWTDTIDFRGPHDIEAKHGEWNVLECQCRPNKITISLNGQKVNEIIPLFPQSGKILLQCEGSEIYFRHLSIRPKTSKN